jgi:hypothetical protein
MASLSNGERTIRLAARVEVGRDPSCPLRLEGRRVSAFHARVVHSDGAWLLRDLGSTNGTFLDGVRLPPGVDRTLAEGARIAFGDPSAVWTLIDAGAPCAVAMREDTGELIAALAGILALPPDEGAVTIYESADGRWVAERHDGVSVIEDGHVLELDGAIWRVRLPVAAKVTPLSEVEGSDIALSFSVGADEETIRVVLVGPGGQEEIPPRACHYLLTLARARIEDRAEGISSLQAGWRDVDALCRLLGAEENRLNVDVFRLRRQLAPYGVPPTIIERRPGERMIRIGCARLVIGPR